MAARSGTVPARLANSLAIWATVVIGVAPTLIFVAVLILAKIGLIQPADLMLIKRIMPV